MTVKTSILGAVVLVSAVLLTGTAGFAETMSIKAELKASSETPPNMSKGMGNLTGTYDTTSKMLTYTATYSDLTGPATMAHFHGPAPVGKAAGVEIPIKGTLDSPITGTVTLTTEQEKNLMDGMTYFNVHTATNKGGEIRGQVAATK